MAKIFLLETDRQLGRAAKQYFKDTHELYHFSDPQMAVTSADINRPDIVILDLFLAGRSGVEFLYELRSYPDWQHLPVLIVGHLPSNELAEYADALMELKVHKYLPKHTTSLKELLNEVESALQSVPR
jgi:DNA-binding response OmpR family regulator